MNQIVLDLLQKESLSCQSIMGPVLEHWLEIRSRKRFWTSMKSFYESLERFCRGFHILIIMGGYHI
jgi:hypothetical protein